MKGTGVAPPLGVEPAAPAAAAGPLEGRLSQAIANSDRTMPIGFEAAPGVWMVHRYFIGLKSLKQQIEAQSGEDLRVALQQEALGTYDMSNPRGILSVPGHYNFYTYLIPRHEVVYFHIVQSLVKDRSVDIKDLA